MRIRRFIVTALVAGCLAGCSAETLDQSLNSVVQGMSNLGGGNSCRSRVSRAAYAAGKTPAQASADVRRQCG